MNKQVDLKSTTAMPDRKSAPYLFHAQTTSLCEVGNGFVVYIAGRGLAK